jgi:hypothetical protein
MKQLKKMSQRGLLDPEQEDPFALFVASTNIRYCYYNETQNILGNTYGMAVLQVRAHVSQRQWCQRNGLMSRSCDATALLVGARQLASCHLGDLIQQKHISVFCIS